MDWIFDTGTRLYDRLVASPWGRLLWVLLAPLWGSALMLSMMAWLIGKVIDFAFWSWFLALLGWVIHREPLAYGRYYHTFVWFEDTYHDREAFNEGVREARERIEARKNKGKPKEF